jgi:hypothetical protein
MSNTDLWDKLGRTDPKHTKGFSRAGGFKGTAIKPMWAFRRMTEEFGACGIGWGINQPAFQVVPSGDGETLVYCTVSIWHGSRDQIVFGVGGDKVVAKRRDGGSFSDDEAFKKSFTDAITNALKLIGVGADVHMGLFDDSKYVAEVAKEFAEEQDDGSAGRTQYIADCKAKLASFPDGDPRVRAWWDNEKQARRDFGLTSLEVEELKTLVIAKIPKQEKAA